MIKMHATLSMLVYQIYWSSFAFPTWLVSIWKEIFQSWNAFAGRSCQTGNPALVQAVKECFSWITNVNFYVSMYIFSETVILNFCLVIVHFFLKTVNLKKVSGQPMWMFSNWMFQFWMFPPPVERVPAAARAAAGAVPLPVARREPQEAKEARGRRPRHGWGRWGRHPSAGMLLFLCQIYILW